MSLPIGPRSSIGSPMTFMIRPSVLGPTGTRICEPVALTVCPRVKPSVESIAIVRTTFSPRCWATSSTRRLPPLSVSSADRIGGSSPSNATSTTAPMTWLTRPVRLLVGLAVGVESAVAAFLARGLGFVSAAVAMCSFFPSCSPAKAGVQSKTKSGAKAPPGPRPAPGSRNYRASAPEIISISSVVITAWRCRLY